MSVYEITYENGEKEIVNAECERDVWCDCGYDDLVIVKVECVGYKVCGEYV